MKKFFYTLLIIISLSACSEYQKAIKSEDTAVKFTLGEKLYNEGKYNKANALFAQIVPNYRGKPQAEKLMFLYSDTFYKLEDYYIASYQFGLFVSNYPKSEKVEEASFLGAKSAYMLSPVYSKDQAETLKAIEKLQSFIEVFPDSKYFYEANKLIKELDYKLEKKAFEIAKQYNRISDYPASIASFNNLILDFPGSSLKEDSYFYRLDSAYKLAINSVESKRLVNGTIIPLKKQRLLEAKTYYTAFKKSFQTSKYDKEVGDMNVDLEEELKKYSI